MSAIEKQLRDVLRSYLEGDLSVSSLRDAQVDLQRKAEARGDTDALAVADHVKILLAEFGRGHRSESSLRAEISEIVQPSTAPSLLGDRSPIAPSG